MRYHTKQRQLLSEFFQKNPCEPFRVEQIADLLADAGQPIGKSSVYRNIHMMVEEGILQRDAIDGERTFAYQYIGGEGCAEHLHLKCSTCGLLLHMQNEKTGGIFHAAEGAGFRIDMKKTILYGSCQACIEKTK